MPNLIKYSTSAVTYTIKKGNIVLGVNNVDYGPTSTSGFYNGITPPISGYTFYINKPSGGPSIYVSTGDTQTIQLIQSLGGTGSTIENTLSWVASQSDIVVANRDYENIVTSGMVLNLDAGFTGSYPKGNQQWYDISGSGNTGTLINGPTFNPLSGGSIVFDGTDDYVTTTNFYLSTSPASILVWFKAGTQTSSAGSILRPIMQQGLFDGAFPSTSQGIEINMIRSGSVDVGKLRFAWGGDVDPNYQYLTNSRYDDNQWHFACNINRGNTFDVYVDGVYLSTKTTHSSVSTSTPVNFGGDSGNSIRRWVGNISIAEIYNRALSTSEVLQNYQSTFTRFLGENIVGNGLALYLDAGYSPSYSGAGTTWYDISGNNNSGTLTNGPTFSGGSIVFDGSDDYVSLGNVVNVTTEPFTLNAWFKQTYDGNYQAIITKGTGSGTGVGYRMLTTPSNPPQAYFDLSDNVTSNTFLSKNTIKPGVWNNVLMVRESLNTFRIYINGILDNTVIKNIGNISSSYPLQVGKQSDASYIFKGQMSIASIYTKALTPFEVYQNYNAQKSRFGIPDIVTSGLILNLDAGNPNSYNPLNTGSTTWTDTTNTTTGGTLVNGTYYSGGTMIFDGTDDYVNISSYPTITNNITLSFWFKTSVTPSSYKGIVTTWTAGQPSLSSYGVQFKNDGTLEPVRPIGSNWNIVTSSTNVVTGSWYHCTVVYNTTGTYLYLNGVLNASNSATGNLNTPLGFKIGSDIAGTNNWNGQISNVSFYNRALSLSEIQQNYNALKDRYGL